MITCVMLQNMLMTHRGGADRTPSPQNDVAALKMNRNPLRQAKHQQELLKHYFSYVGALAQQEDRI